MEQQNSLPAVSIPAGVRTRIIDAANQLFQDGGAERFPSVADVRRLAKTDMNATSAVMRDWKRQQSAKPAPVAVSVPEAVQQAALEQSSIVWLAAQELANGSLRVAQNAWAVERAEMEGMRQELAQLFEAQVAELESLRQELLDSTKAKEEAETTAEQLAERLNVQQNRADRAETRAEALQVERNQARQEAITAREGAAHIRGQLEAVQKQNEALLERLGKLKDR